MLISRDLQVGDQTLNVCVDVSTEIQCHDILQDMLDTFVLTQSEKSIERMFMDLQNAVECTYSRWDLFKLWVYYLK